MLHGKNKTICISLGCDAYSSFQLPYLFYVNFQKSELTDDDIKMQRTVCGISQIFPLNPDAVSEEENSEGHLTYYDIFVRNAFGNYFDILKEVSYM